MRIYRERIAPVAAGIVDALLAGELIEIEADLRDEVELDVASVLQEYRRTDWELSEKARDLVAVRGLDYSHTHKLKSQLAKKASFGIGDDAIEWIVQQILEILLQSKNVEEIFGEDHELRRLLAPVLRRELGVGSDLDHEVKKRIRNLEEGTSDYEIEYQRTMERLKRAKGLTD